MNSQNQLMPATDFLGLLADKEARSRLRLGTHTTVVTGDVCINGKELDLVTGKSDKPIASVGFRNLTFTGSVRVENVEELSFTAQQTNFLKGLSFCGCTGGWLSIHSCQMQRFDGFRNSFEALVLRKVQGEPAADARWQNQQNPVVDIFGFTLSKKLVFEGVEAKELVTHCERVSASLSTPEAIVDDPLWAFQLRLAGIPVHISTELARNMLQPGSFAARMAQIA